MRGTSLGKIYSKEEMKVKKKKSGSHEFIKLGKFYNTEVHKKT